tara:strand:- start:3519 stop:4517 length:999 start_codon:yes stop_codon:yes gene_type:complete
MKKKINFKEKIFIAGSSGMAGSAILKALKRKGYGEPKHNGELLIPKRSDLDLLDESAVHKWFKDNKPSIVVIAAAKVGGILANASQPATFLMENIKIQTNLIEASWKFGVKRLLFLGSSCIYPKFASQPINEESLLSGPLEQTNEPYAIAKIAGIKLCESLRIQYGFDAICLMPTNLYGPGDNYHPTESHVMASLIRKFCNASKNNENVMCWGTGSPYREFMHVDDLGEAVVFALEKWDPNSQDSPKDQYGTPLIYLNVGTGKDISIFDLAKKIAKITDFHGKVIWDKTKPDGTPKKQLDISKITKLGWEAKIDLEEGIKSTVSEFCKINFK